MSIHKYKGGAERARNGHSLIIKQEKGSVKHKQCEATENKEGGLLRCVLVAVHQTKSILPTKS